MNYSTPRTNYSTPQENYSMRTNDTKYTRENRQTNSQTQYTPRINTTNDRYERNNTPIISRFNGNPTQDRNRYENEWRDRNIQRTGKIEQMQRYQQYTQNNNQQANFLERGNEMKRSQRERSNYQQFQQRQ